MIVISLSRTTRVITALAYLGLALAGASMIIDPDQIWPKYYQVMGGILLVGSLFAIAAAILGHWGFYALGLPLIASALMGFAVLVSSEDVSWATAPNALILFGMSLVLYGRWWNILLLSRFYTKEPL